MAIDEVLAVAFEAAPEGLGDLGVDVADVLLVEEGVAGDQVGRRLRLEHHDVRQQLRLR